MLNFHKSHLSNALGVLLIDRLQYIVIMIPEIFHDVDIIKKQSFIRNGNLVPFIFLSTVEGSEKQSPIYDDPRKV